MGGSTFNNVNAASIVDPISGTFGGRTIRTGFTVGGGFEYAFTRNVSFKLEGLYYDLGTVRDTAVATSTALGLFVSTNGVTRSQKFDGEIARFGINYLF